MLELGSAVDFYSFSSCASTLDGHCIVLAQSQIRARNSFLQHLSLPRNVCKTKPIRTHSSQFLH